MEEAALRQKYWSEITESEKIERLRSEIKRLQHTTNYLLEMVEALSKHEHNPSGKVLCALQPDRLRGALSVDRGKGDDVYL